MIDIISSIKIHTPLNFDDEETCKSLILLKIFGVPSKIFKDKYNFTWQSVSPIIKRKHNKLRELFGKNQFKYYTEFANQFLRERLSGSDFDTMLYLYALGAPYNSMLGLPPEYKIRFSMVDILKSNTTGGKYKSAKKMRSSNSVQYGATMLKLTSTEEDRYNTKLKRQRTNLKRYGVDHVSKVKAVREKAKVTNLKRYGVEYATQNEDLLEKRNINNFKKYGVENVAKHQPFIEKMKETNLERYGKPYSCQLINVINKANETKRKNKTFSTSHPEDKVYEILTMNFGKENVLRQYNSNLYPFNCDFYIKSLNMYIECDFFWTHGGHLFNADCQSDMETFLIWYNRAKENKFYRLALQNWTVRDPLKHWYQKKNNLNFKRYYTFEEFKKNYMEDLK